MFHQRVKKNVEQVFDVNVFLKVTPFAEIPCPSNRTEFLTNLIYKLSFVKWLFKEHDFTVLLCPFNTDTSGFATKRKTRRILAAGTLVFLVFFCLKFISITEILVFSERP